jgi:hypothetical protein
MDLTDVAFLIQGKLVVTEDETRAAHQRYTATLFDKDGEACSTNWDGMERPARQSGKDEVAALERLALLLQDSLLSYPRDWHGKRITEYMGLPPIINVECMCEPPETRKKAAS